MYDINPNLRTDDKRCYIYVDSDGLRGVDIVGRPSSVFKGYSIENTMYDLKLQVCYC